MKSLTFKNYISAYSQTWILLLLLGSTMYSQKLTKKPVTEADYKLWGTMYEHTVSDNGTWATAYMHHENSPDTLHINQVKGKKTHKIANPGEGHFYGDQKYAIVDELNTLQVIDLETGIQQKISHVYSFAIAIKNNYLVTLESTSDKNVISIRNYNGQVVESLLGFTEFKMSPSSQSMIAMGNVDGVHRVVLVDFSKQVEKKIITEERLYQFSLPVWSSSNGSFVFIKKALESSDVSIGFYSLKTHHLQYFSKETTEVPKGYVLNSDYIDLSISPDDQRVFFDIHKDIANDTTSKIVEIWKGTDALIYPKSKKLTELQHKIRYGVWYTNKNKFKFITSDRRPVHLLNPTMDVAITYSLSEKAPHYGMYLTVDYYITNLETGEEKLMIANQTIADGYSGFSPNGNYFAYYKDNVWLLYDLKGQKHMPQFNTNFSNWDFIQNGDKSIFGIAGWGLKNDCIYIHDQFDVWRVPFDSSTPTRLTQGREQKIAYRMVHLTKNVRYNFTGSVEVDLSQNLILSGTGENATGFFIRKPNGIFKTMVFNSHLNSNIAKATNESLYVFQSQHYNHPHALNSYNSKTNQITKIFQSNQHHSRFLWGKQEEIYFKNNKNELLKAVLYYPVDYKSDKQYPMVVSIYQELNYLKHYYFNPSFYNSAGFNVANLTAQGYFVLLPDITYEIGNPGLSATDCVISATDTVIRMGVVAKDKIALMGHSFGGYETNFIITQTSLFKTAISGASVFDLPSWYLSVSKNTGDPEIWRFESQQWRMQKSLFDNRDGYERNSPSKWVENVTTPLLLWTGENDTQINPNQSIAYYLALRRLNKHNALLIYKDEGHALVKKESQIDLYNRINDWLGYYLKDLPPKPWINKEI